MMYNVCIDPVKQISLQGIFIKQDSSPKGAVCQLSQSLRLQYWVNQTVPFGFLHI